MTGYGSLVLYRF